MKKISSLFLLCLALLLITSSVQANSQGKQVEIIFTHDLHSYLEEYATFLNGEIEKVGGLPRLQTIIAEKRAKSENVLVVDAGDFSMGTLYHTLFTTQALELRMLGRLGFDATTFGNHEFDFGVESLKDMIEVASQEAYLPYLLNCNIDWEYENESTKSMNQVLNMGKIQDYAIVEKGNTRIAIIGVLSKDAHKDAPACDLQVLDPIESVKNTVATIKKDEEVDMIVCISHGGTNENSKHSEDELLAQAVPELDVIVSGHTHTKLEQPIIVDQTYIVGCGAYGLYTGTAAFTQTANKRWELKDYELILMDQQIEQDQKIQQELKEFQYNINEEYLDALGYKIDQVIVNNNIIFETVEDMYYVHTEHALGNLMSDAYRYAVNENELSGGNVDVAIVPAGYYTDFF